MRIMSASNAWVRRREVAVLWSINRQTYTTLRYVVRVGMAVKIWFGERKVKTIHPQSPKIKSLYVTRVNLVPTFNSTFRAHYNVRVATKENYPNAYGVCLPIVP